MSKLLTLLFVCKLSLLALTPTLYKPIGDPVYSEIPAVTSLSEMTYFQKEKTQMQGFVQRALQHKKLGLSYDKKRHSKTLQKEEQKIYLKGLRELDHELKNIYGVVRRALNDIIKSHDVKTFYRLKRTKIGLLKLDPKSAADVRKFERKIERDKRLRREKKIKQDKAAKIAYYRFLRSPKNLNGKWSGKDMEGTKMSAVFEKNRVRLNYLYPKETTLFKGSYTIKKDDFKFLIEESERRKSGVAHNKKVNLERTYKILKLNEKEFSLQHKDEIIRLKRKNQGS